MSERRANLDEIISVIGEVNALLLVRQIGGATYYFPPDGAKSDQVSIEPEAWKVLCHHFSGWVYVPNCKMAEIDLRNAEIRKKYCSGENIVDLVRMYKLSDRRIRHVCKGLAEQRRKKTG